MVYNRLTIGKLVDFHTLNPAKIKPVERGEGGSGPPENTHLVRHRQREAAI